MNVVEQAIRGTVESSDKPVVLCFSATWCGPCKMFAPVFEKATAQLSDKYTLLKVDIDEMAALASEYEVMSVPTLVHTEKGQIIKKRNGAFPTVEHVEKWILS